MLYDFDNGKKVTENLNQIYADLMTIMTTKRFHKIKYKKSTNALPTKSNMNISSKSKYKKVPDTANVYFIFDANNSVRYVGKKEDKKGINYRLMLHLVANKTKSTSSCISQVIEEIKKGVLEFRYYAIEVNPPFMSPAVESYFIDFFKSNNQCDFVRRK